MCPSAPRCAPPTWQPACLSAYLGACPSLFLSFGLAPHCFVELPSCVALDVSVLARETFMLCLTVLQLLLFLHGSRRCHGHLPVEQNCRLSDGRAGLEGTGSLGSPGRLRAVPGCRSGCRPPALASGCAGGPGESGDAPAPGPWEPDGAAPWGPRWQPSAFELTLLGPSGQKSTLGCPRRSGEGDESTAFLPALERSVLLPR